jgi:arylsulfatase A-like enzyme
MNQRPNIVFMFPDQLRPDFLSCYGAAFIDTPNIDWLAQNGVRYERAYSASPVCVPARTALLTGMNAIRNGVTDNLRAVRADYNAVGIRTWPQLFSDVGYYTAAVGKMHFYPWDARHGFQYRVIAEDKRWLQVRDDYYHFLKEHGLRKLHGNEHEGYYENKGAVVSRIPWEYSWDRFVGQEACRFIENYGEDGPFAMMVGFPGPHCPYDPSPEFLEGFSPDDMPDSIPEVPGDTPLLRQNIIDNNKRPWNGVDHTEFTEENKKKIRAHYCGLVKQIDYEVGEIINTLRSKGLLDNTILIFSTDHADYLGDHNLIGKASFYETAMKIPLIVSGPGVEKGKTSSELVELRDVTATMLGFAGIEIPDYMDSQPLPGLGFTNQPPRDRIFGMLTEGWMIFDGEWKLAKYDTGEIVLFNLKDDPNEQNNLVSAPAWSHVYRRLDAELTQELLESYRISLHDRLVQSGDMSQSAGFGREGWQRTYPAPIRFATDR